MCGTGYKNKPRDMNNPHIPIDDVIAIVERERKEHEYRSTPNMPDLGVSICNIIIDKINALKNPSNPKLDFDFDKEIAFLEEKIKEVQFREPASVFLQIQDEYQKQIHKLMAIRAAKEYHQTKPKFDMKAFRKWLSDCYLSQEYFQEEGRVFVLKAVLEYLEKFDHD